MKPVLRALDILAPLASRLGSATINGNDVGKSNVARGKGWLIWRAGFRRVINRPEQTDAREESGAVICGPGVKHWLSNSLRSVGLY
jgi:hypothetical protein